ncbi:hypothetical protein FDP41_004107 [Naegleria fowleri]|uniref:Pyrimidine 5'-nucleotidase n=1 Tax=Naegleria fowleri TaxID=5763 RepID=A0A6A5BPS7_NAEFO|nr:uncharacterized protein FDP41_004107 [Naegleria fowleri]KAF0976812.1 hypothetical protein FDP41_004107 [Naegleria fowleri]CAG4717930.1 unnamed protein product [Naegleria fowleri]
MSQPPFPVPSSSSSLSDDSSSSSTQSEPTMTTTPSEHQHSQPNHHVVRYFFFDLDDCLYPKSSGVNIHVRNRIAQYLSEQLGIENAMEKSVNLYLQHGTTLRGLIAEGYNVDPITFYHYVHSGFDLDGVQQHDEELHSMIAKLKQNVDKVVLFTNSDKRHAKRLLNHLGILELFDQIVCYEDLELSVKPHPHAYELAAEISGLPSGSLENHTPSWKDMIVNSQLEIYFADDNLKNVMAAFDMGWNACWVCEQEGVQPPPNEGIPFVQDVKQLPKVWPHLFQ